MVLAAGCSAPAALPDDVGAVEPVLVERPEPRVEGALRVAAIFPTVGRYAISGIQSLNGARLAIDDVNARGGIHGRPLELLEYRTGSYFLDAARAAGMAAAEGRVLGVVGSNSSSLSMAVAEVVEAHGLVEVSNVSTAHDLTWDPDTGRVRSFVFRVCSSDTTMGRQLARYARGALSARRVAVLFEVGRTYSADLARSFIESFEEGGEGRTTEEFVYLPLETDFRNLLRDIDAWEPDAVFLPGSFTDATLVAMQARQIGLDATLLGADGWSNRLLFARGGPARPAFFADHCAPPAAFEVRYRRAYGEESDGCRAVLAHDAVKALAAALERLGPLQDRDLEGDLRALRARVRDALAGLEIEGAAGPVRFDAHGDSQRSVAIMRTSVDADGQRRTRLVRLLKGP
jgi:branched-chain amino acid transport system substrate-binding protein